MPRSQATEVHKEVVHSAHLKMIKCTGLNKYVVNNLDGPRFLGQDLGMLEYIWVHIIQLIDIIDH